MKTILVVSLSHNTIWIFTDLSDCIFVSTTTLGVQLNIISCFTTNCINYCCLALFCIALHWIEENVQLWFITGAYFDREEVLSSMNQIQYGLDNWVKYRLVCSQSMKENPNSTLSWFLDFGECPEPKKSLSLVLNWSDALLGVTKITEKGRCWYSHWFQRTNNLVTDSRFFSHWWLITHNLATDGFSQIFWSQAVSGTCRETRYGDVAFPGYKVIIMTCWWLCWCLYWCLCWYLNIGW